MNLLTRFSLWNTLLVVGGIVLVSTIQIAIVKDSSKEVLEDTTKLTSQTLMKQLYERANHSLRYFSEALVNPLYMYDLESTYRLLNPALSSKKVDAIVVFDDNGKIFHEAERKITSYGALFERTDVLNVVLTEQRDYSNETKLHYELATPIFLGDKLLGGLFLQFSLTSIHGDINNSRQLISDFTQLKLMQIQVITVVSVLFVCLMSLSLSVFLTRSITGPISDLVDHVKRMSQGDFSRLNKVSSSDEVGILANSFNDLSVKLQLRTKEMEFLAYHDPLTKLPNREYFLQLLNALIRKRKAHFSPLFVMFIDLDEFKNTNDTFGHPVGDALLRQVSERIITSLRRTDFNSECSESQAILARVGGDEFLLCLPQLANDSEASTVAKRLIKLIKRPITIEGKELFINASVGISSFSASSDTGNDLIKNADIAMYEAKAKGKGTFSHFNAEMNNRLEHRSLIETELRKAQTALEQFEIWLQPQIDLNSGRVVGAEALIRWRHPKLGLIHPDEFIYIAESTGLIIPIGDWLIESVCQHLVDWSADLPPKFHIAINISAKQLYRQNTCEKIVEMLDKHNLAADRLHVEVTESLLIKNERKAQQYLKSLSDAGVQVWLDDFGTGYSSLKYLRQFSFDGVKIDRDFIRDIDTDTYDQALSGAIISMANDLGMSVVAEGIETATQEAFLKTKSCNIGQGYYYSKPLTTDAFRDRYLADNTSTKTTLALVKM
ncbi:EAL domain-containing protein [Photobacterium kasasachensis]|uniref:EAL domain-containing protein n=1 Tax=Photobacterium kasasachensis TaxID=2910240 RepID=UPI003D0E510D